jgi:deazaflavin-dependent oxidoreductase (nitroreductase family)
MQSPQKLNWLNRLIRAFAASRGGAIFGSRLWHHADRTFLKLSRRRVTLTSLISGLPVVMLTTIGAKSGLPRTVPLIRIPDPDNPAVFALIASNWGQRHYPGWYHNLKANPRAVVNRRGQVSDSIAQEIDGAEYDRFWQIAQETYFGFSCYAKRVKGRHIPIMVMTPADDAPSPKELRRG